MGVIVLTILVVALVFWLSRKRISRSSPIRTGIIHIVVENGGANKKKTTERSTIIQEAEVLFLSLQNKYLYSPIPFKVMGDFYAQKGLVDKALEKYSQMTRYLNADLSLEKLVDAVAFMRSRGADDTANTIVTFYKQEGD